LNRGCGQNGSGGKSDVEDRALHDESPFGSR
jgi:hypothetical protein